MSDGAGFEAWLAGKKIDSEAFRLAEPEVWMAWKSEFEQVHPNSFTVQKLNLINAIRRKYLLPPDLAAKPPAADTVTTTPAPPVKTGKPVMRPRPKF